MAGLADKLSVAVIVSAPTEFKVTPKVPMPLANMASAGSTAWLSLLVK